MLRKIANIPAKKSKYESPYIKELKPSTNLRLHKRLVGDNGKDDAQESTMRFQWLSDIHHVEFVEKEKSAHF